MTKAILDTHIRDNFNAVSRAVYKSAGSLDVVSSAAQTNVLSQSIAGNTIGANGTLRATLTGDYLNNTGSNQTLLISTGYAGSSPHVTTMTIAPAAGRRAIRWIAELTNINSTGTQWVNGVFSVSDTTGATFGLGVESSMYGLSASNHEHIPFSGAGTFSTDSTVNQTFLLAVQHGSSSASLSFRRFMWVIELIPSPT